MKIEWASRALQAQRTRDVSVTLNEPWVCAGEVADPFGIATPTEPDQGLGGRSGPSECQFGPRALADAIGESVGTLSAAADETAGEPMTSDPKQQSPPCPLVGPSPVPASEGIGSEGSVSESPAPESAQPASACRSKPRATSAATTCKTRIRASSRDMAQTIGARGRDRQALCQWQVAANRADTRSDVFGYLIFGQGGGVSTCARSECQIGGSEGRLGDALAESFQSATDRARASRKFESRRSARYRCQCREPCPTPARTCR